MHETLHDKEDFVNALALAEETKACTVSQSISKKKTIVHSNLRSVSNPMVADDIYKAVKQQEVPVVFMSYCTSKLLMWVLVPIKCCSIQLSTTNPSICLAATQDYKDWEYV